MSENKIKAARIAAGMNIKELADLLHAPYRTVQDWNAGNRQPPAWIEKFIIAEIERNSKGKMA